MSNDNIPGGQQPYPPQQPYGAQPPPYAAPQAYPSQADYTPVGPVVDNSVGAAGVVMAIVSLLIPIVGLIMFLVWRVQHPVRARWCGIAAIIGVVLGIIIRMAG